MTTRWQTISGEDIPNIEEFVAKAAAGGQPVHIGTDSLQTGRHTQFVTVVAVLNPPKGGRAAYHRVVEKRITSLRERLLREVWLSVELAMQLSPLVPGELTVHVDANPNEKHMSSKYVQELVGLVVSQGFRALIKPEAWAASTVADWTVRHLNARPRGQGKSAVA